MCVGLTKRHLVSILTENLPDPDREEYDSEVRTLLFFRPSVGTFRLVILFNVNSI